MQSLAPINPHWARVVGYGPFSLCMIYRECLCPSSGDINRLMMMVDDEYRQYCMASSLLAKPVLCNVSDVKFTISYVSCPDR
jgi:hypothetical protein